MARCSRGRLVAFVHESFVIEVHFSCSVSVVSIPLILSAWSSVPRYVCRVLFLRGPCHFGCTYQYKRARSPNFCVRCVNPAHFDRLEQCTLLHFLCLGSMVGDPSNFGCTSHCKSARSPNSVLSVNVAQLVRLAQCTLRLVVSWPFDVVG